MSAPRRRRSHRSALYKTAALLVPVVFFLPFLGRPRIESWFGEDAAAGALAWTGPVGVMCLVAVTLAADAAMAFGVALWRLRATRPLWALALCCVVVAAIAGAGVAARRAPGTVPELLLACLFDERTLFADGYTHARFAQVAPGMSEAEVTQLLGEPI